MGRSSTITYEEVVQVLNSLQATGKKITIANVKEALDGRGSPMTISKYLKTWRNEGKLSEAQGAATAKPTPGRMIKEETLVPASKPNTQDDEDESEQDARVSSLNEQETPSLFAHDETSEQSVAQQQMPPKKNFRHKEKGDNRHHNARERFRRHERNDHKPMQAERQEYQPVERQPKYDDIAEQITSAFGEYYQISNLDSLDEQALKMNIRRLETCLNKEQSRRDAAEKMAREAKEYAEIIKEQIAHRINDLQAMMDVQINQLKSEINELREQSEADLDYYRRQLNKANDKLLNQMGPAHL